MKFAFTPGRQKGRRRSCIFDAGAAARPGRWVPVDAAAEPDEHFHID